MGTQNFLLWRTDGAAGKKNVAGENLLGNSKGELGYCFNSKIVRFAAFSMFLWCQEVPSIS